MPTFDFNKSVLFRSTIQSKGMLYNQTAWTDKAELKRNGGGVFIVDVSEFSSYFYYDSDVFYFLFCAVHMV